MDSLFVGAYSAPESHTLGLVKLLVRDYTAIRSWCRRLRLAAVLPFVSGYSHDICEMHCVRTFGVKRIPNNALQIHRAPLLPGEVERGVVAQRGPGGQDLAFGAWSVVGLLRRADRLPQPFRRAPEKSCPGGPVKRERVCKSFQRFGNAPLIAQLEKNSQAFFERRPGRRTVALIAGHEPQLAEPGGDALPLAQLPADRHTLFAKRPGGRIVPLTAGHDRHVVQRARPAPPGSQVPPCP